MISFVETEDPAFVYTSMGCKIPNPKLFPRATMTRPALRLHEPVRFDHEKLFHADPECRHYITWGIGGGVRCVHCSAWYCL